MYVQWQIYGRGLGPALLMGENTLGTPPKFLKGLKGQKGFRAPHLMTRSVSTTDIHVQVLNCTK